MQTHALGAGACQAAAPAHTRRCQGTGSGERVGPRPACATHMLTKVCRGLQLPEQQRYLRALSAHSSWRTRKRWCASGAAPRSEYDHHLHGLHGTLRGTAVQEVMCTRGGHALQTTQEHCMSLRHCKAACHAKLPPMPALQTYARPQRREPACCASFTVHCTTDTARPLHDVRCAEHHSSTHRPDAERSGTCTKDSAVIMSV